MQTTDNFRKHTTKSFIQRFLMDHFFQKLLSVVREINPKQLLDVGAGEGFTLAKLQRAGVTAHVEGIEYLPLAIELGKKANPNIKLVQGTIYDLPYKANSFDLVLCTEVLEHLEDPKKALAELVRVSKKYVLLSVPHEPWFMLGNFFRGKNLSRWGNDIEHINHWTGGQFKQFVSIHLKVVAIYHPLPWTLILAEKK